MNVVLNGPQWLIIEKAFAKVAPEDVIRAFLEPDMLARWWTPESSVDPQVGGEWIMEFPQMSSTLMGQLAEVTPRSIMASWVFTHDPATPTKMMRAEAFDDAEGARLRITQGPYFQSEHFPGEDEERAGHLEGWQWFLPRLADALKPQSEK